MWRTVGGNIDRYIGYPRIVGETGGAFVDLQTFGGARASGTNEKVGSKRNAGRRLSPRTIKENFNPAADFRYDLMQESLVSDSFNPGRFGAFRLHGPSLQKPSGRL